MYIERRKLEEKIKDNFEDMILSMNGFSPLTTSFRDVKEFFSDDARFKAVKAQDREIWFNQLMIKRRAMLQDVPASISTSVSNIEELDSLIYRQAQMEMAKEKQA